MPDLYCIWPHISQNARGMCVQGATRFSLFEKATFHPDNIVFRHLYLLTINTDIRGAHFLPAWFSLCNKDHGDHQFSVKN